MELTSPYFFDDKAGVFGDDRGLLSYVENITMTIERFYIVQNYKEGFIRAWHGHKKETKTAYVVTGAALFYAIEMNEETMPLNKVPLKWVLDERTQGILIIPPKYYHGFKTLTADTKVMFFSNMSSRDSVGDDFRLEWDFFGRTLWEEKYR